MGIKVSVGMSDERAERELLEQVRRHGPKGEPADADCEARAAGWPMGSSTDDELEPERSLWAW